jgi:hypothetical protein
MARPNSIMLSINIRNDVAIAREQNEANLINQITTITDMNEGFADMRFRLTCRKIAKGYALYRKVLTATGMQKYKPAIRRYPEFVALPQKTKTEHLSDMEYIVPIYHNWDTISKNCNEEGFQYIDVRDYKLWKLARCFNIDFVKEEDAKSNPNSRRSVRRPIARSYDIDMVEDILDNVPASTERLLQQVNHDPEQIKLITKDFGNALLRRAPPLPHEL